MGTLVYDHSGPAITIDDRALSHLKVVIVSKLRRGESFSVSWDHPDDAEGRRTTIWVHPSIPLRFIFDEPVAPELNREWLAELAESANELGGIHLVQEHID